MIQSGTRNPLARTFASLTSNDLASLAAGHRGLNWWLANRSGAPEGKHSKIGWLFLQEEIDEGNH
jgi:hypothetical protein